MLSFFPRGVLDVILNLIESVSEDFPSYSLMYILLITLMSVSRYNANLNCYANINWTIDQLVKEYECWFILNRVDHTPYIFSCRQ